MADATIRGRFVWHELMTTDTGAAAAFYLKVIGWKAQPWTGDPSYTTWVTDRGPVGGLMSLPDDAKATGAPPCWLFYAGTPDIQGTVQEAQRLGAQIVKDVTEIPNTGKFAVLSDPQGAVFAVYSAENPTPPDDAEPKIGEFSWHELATTDSQAALSFYRQLLGWENTGSHDMGPMGIYQMFGWGGRSMGGMYNKPAEMPAPPHWLCYAFVPDVAVAAEAARIAGGQVVHGPVEVPGGDWIAQIIDPQGAAFAVHAAKKTAAVEPQPPAAPSEKPRPAPKPKAMPKIKPKPKAKPKSKAQPKAKPKVKKVAARKKAKSTKATSKTRKPARKPVKAKKRVKASAKKRR